MDWLTNAPKEYIVALLTAASTFILTLFVVFIKDFLLSIYREDRSKTKSRIETFRTYASPIIKSSESLCWRIKEMFESRGAFLLKDELTNEFFMYKFISTCYRLCSLLGYIRATQKEYSYITIHTKKANACIEKAILDFQNSLADGQHMEMSIFLDLSNLWGFDIQKLPNSEKAKIAIKLENELYSFSDSKELQNIKTLSMKNQIKLLNSLALVITDSVGSKKLGKSVIMANRDNAINMIVRQEAWIYRDWQSAIGDMMLIPVEQSSNKFTVMGYGQFENLFSEGNIWIKRIKTLFTNLNVDADSAYDGRIDQLKNVFICSLRLIIAFKDNFKRIENIEIRSFEELKRFNDTISKNNG